MTSTYFLDFVPLPPLCLQNLHCLSANLLNFLIPPSVWTSYMEAPQVDSLRGIMMRYISLSSFKHTVGIVGKDITWAMC